MIAVPDFRNEVLNVYSLSSTFSILIQGLPLDPPLFIILNILNIEIKIIGIQRINAGLSIGKLKEIFKLK
tara:strand:- start:1034 stop:1243 length:210 start_codon:yes stop_codon:yes gene_type:complete